MESINACEALAIDDLRDRPDFACDVADRLWQTWWRAGGTPRAALEARVAQTIATPDVPFCVVAHDDDAFLGTATVIAGDNDNDNDNGARRPPWLSALWVEPERRGCGIATRLLQATTARAAALGATRLYLCARPELVDFYLMRGWALLEGAVGAHRLLVFACAADG